MFTSNAGVILGINDEINLGFQVERTGGTFGTQNLSVNVTSGTGGGETPTNNNVAAIVINML